MGVTAIKEIVNRTNVPVYLENHENSGNNLRIEANTTKACDIWIPWCASSADFEHNHYLTITIGEGGRTQWIWQNHNTTGDRVRVSPEGRFHPNQTPIEGDAHVNGKRRLIIGYNGLLEMEVINS